MKQFSSNVALRSRAAQDVHLNIYTDAELWCLELSKVLSFKTAVGWGAAGIAQW